MLRFYLKKAGFRRLFLFLVFQGFDSVLKLSDPGLHEIQHHEQKDNEEAADRSKNDFG
mgnify:CR=1 FL=1